MVIQQAGAVQPLAGVVERGCADRAGFDLAPRVEVLARNAAARAVAAGAAYLGRTAVCLRERRLCLIGRLVAQAAGPPGLAPPQHPASGLPPRTPNLMWLASTVLVCQAPVVLTVVNCRPIPLE